MPPVKKNNLNNIFQYKNLAKVIEAETIAEKDNSIENTNTKSLDTYFGITEKPPSPIPEIISNVEKELDRNDTLTLIEISELSQLLNITNDNFDNKYEVIKNLEYNSKNIQLLYTFFDFVALNPMFFLVPLLKMGMGTVHQCVGSHLEAQESR